MSKGTIILKSPTVTPIQLAWSSLGERFITSFSSHAMERLVDYKLDVNTVNVPIALLANEMLDFKNNTNFAIIDSELQNTLVCNLTCYDDLTIEITVITLLNHVPYSKKHGDFALYNIETILMTGGL